MLTFRYISSTPLSFKTLSEVSPAGTGCISRRIMKFLLFAFTAALASAVPSPAPDIPTVTVIVTVPPSSAPATAAIVPQAESTERQQQEDQPQPTTSTTSSYSRPSTSSTISDTITSSVQQSASSQTHSEAASASSAASDTYYEPGQSNLGAGVVDTDAGASGSDAAAFRLSKGGLAGILIVVILVSLFGSKSSKFHGANHANMLDSRKHNPFHRSETSSMDNAPDSQTCFSPPYRSIWSTQDIADRVRSKSKIPTRWHPDGQSPTSWRQSCVPPRPQERSCR